MALRKLPTMSASSKRILSLWQPVAVILSLPLFLALQYVVGTDALSLIGNAILFATLVALVWYSWETRALRLHQERDAAIRNHPWIDVVHERHLILPLERDGLPIPSFNFDFRLANTGATTAFQIRIRTTWTALVGDRVTSVNPNAQQEVLSQDGTYAIGFVQPSSAVPFSVSVILEQLSGDALRIQQVRKISVHLMIMYSTCDGGDGRVDYTYEVTNPTGAGMESEERSVAFKLADGRIFPAHIVRREEKN